MAASLSWWRLTVATIVLVVAWLVIDGELWDPDDDSAPARERSRLYDTSTLPNLTAGMLICYLAPFVVNLVWAMYPRTGCDGRLPADGPGYGDVVVLAWLVASAATVGGGLESDDAIRAAANSKREEERRSRLAWERTNT